MQLTQPHAPAVALPAADRYLASIAAREQQQRTFLLAERGALALDGFRVAAGVGLCLHFIRHLLGSSALLESSVRAGAHAGWLTWLIARGVPAGALFAVASVLAAAVALGLWTKPCAALLWLFCVPLRRLLAHSARLDDWTADVVLCWLLLLPVGKTLIVGRGALRARYNRWRAQRVPGHAPAVFAAQVLALHLWVDGFRRLSPHWHELAWVALALTLLPGWYLLPLGRLRVLGPVCQCALHAYLGWQSGEWLTHLVLAASAFVLYGEPRRAASASLQPSRPLDAGFALALAGSVLLAIAVVQQLGNSAETRGRALHVLSDLGLAPRAGGDR
jgi:hypothetical protein